MDVKEVNTVLGLSLLGKNTPTNSNAFIGDAFSNLLENHKPTPDFSANNTEFAARTDINDANAQNVVKAQDKPARKEKEPVKEVKEKAEAPAKEAAADADKKIDKSPKDDSKTSVEDAKADTKEAKPSDENKSVAENSDDVEETNQAVVINPLLMDLIPLNPQTVVSDTVVDGSMETAAEVLAQPVAAAVLPQDASADEAAAQPIASQASPDAAKEGIDISQLTAVVEENVDVDVPEIATVAENAPKTQKSGAAKSAALVEGADEIETTVSVDEPAEKVSKLAEVIDLGKKVKVDVKTSNDEEKIAYNGTSGLLKNTEAVAEVEPHQSAQRTPKAAAAQETLTTAPSQQANQAAVNNNPALNVQNAAPAADVATMLKTAEVKTDAVQGAKLEVGAVNMAHAASGSEFVNAAKLNAASELKTSANDIYKGMSKEVVEQVKVNITKSAVKGVDKIDIHLKPEDLGQIEIKMQLSKNGKLQAEIVASRPETMEMLQKEAQSLQKAFNDAGFQTDDNSFSFTYRDDSQQANQNQEKNSGLRQFMGELLDNEISNDNAVSYAEQSWNGKSGLNIRV